MEGRGKLSAAVAGIATVFLMAGAAQAGEGKVLRGDLDGGGEAQITVKYTDKQGVFVRRTSWRLGPIEVRCDGDGQPRIAADKVTGSEYIRAKYADRNGFSGGALNVSVDGAARYKTYVRGEFVTKRKVTGFVRVNGKAVPLEGGGHADCDSGRLHFTATR